MEGERRKEGEARRVNQVCDSFYSLRFFRYESGNGMRYGMLIPKIYDKRMRMGSGGYRPHYCISFLPSFLPSSSCLRNIWTYVIGNTDDELPFEHIIPDFGATGLLSDWKRLGFILDLTLSFALISLFPLMTGSFLLLLYPDFL
jgi:hypothetical protein